MTDVEDSVTAAEKRHRFEDLLASLEIALTGASVAPGSSVATSTSLLATVCRDGTRTTQLMRIAGYMLGRGVDEADVAQICLDWNARNDPPMGEAKVRATVSSLDRTHRRNHPGSVTKPLEPLQPLFDLAAAEVGSMLSTSPSPRDWLLDKCLPLGKVGSLVAQGGTGKSQLLLQLGVAVATGAPLCDYWQVGEQGNVVLIFGEDDRDDVHRRLSVIAQELQPNVVDFDQLVGDHLKVVSVSASDVRMTTRLPRGGVEPTDFVERFVLAVANFPDIKLIVFDPASRFRGGDENSAEDATRFVQQLERLVADTGATVLVAHHVHKGASKSEDSDQNASRGSSALTDGVRWQMNLRPASAHSLKAQGLQPQPGKYLAAAVTKNNYAPPTDETILVRKDNGYLVVLGASSGAMTLEDRLMDLVRAEAAANRSYSINQIETRFGGQTGPFQVGKNAVRDALRALVQIGRLKKGKHQHLVEVNPAAIQEYATSALSSMADRSMGPSTPPSDAIPPSKQ